MMIEQLVDNLKLFGPATISRVEQEVFCIMYYTSRYLLSAVIMQLKIEWTIRCMVLTNTDQ